MSENRSLFDSPDSVSSKEARDVPLAEAMRPNSLEEIVGLETLISPGKFLRAAIDSDRLPSLIFWGPPGSGKTTLAHVIAKRTNARFVSFSAVTSGIKEVRAIMEAARRTRRLQGTSTIVFIDEIHRFNRAQQDAFLPYVESGDIVLLGATTENPSFEVNAALLSRCKVVVLPNLTHENVKEILARAISSDRVSVFEVGLTDDAVEFIASISGGDARQALASLQLVIETSPPASRLDATGVQEILSRRSLRYDKSGEEHFNLISALHKSIRDGDTDASVYWLVRIMEGGEDPMYVARRLVRAAAEDVGLADPDALRLAVAAKDAVHFIGMPEGGVVLAELAIYLAQAPKSNRVYRAYEDAKAEVLNGDDPPVPLHLRNATTSLMKNLGYGKGYDYAHEHEEGTAGMTCLPESLVGRRFYEPSDAGREQEIRKRIDALRKLREDR